MTSLRSAESAAYDAPSDPFPSMGSSICATVRASFTRIVIGLWTRPAGTAPLGGGPRSPPATLRVVDRRRLDHDDGRIRLTGEGSLEAVVDLDRRAGPAAAPRRPGVTVLISERGQREGEEHATDESDRRRTGRRRTRSRIQPQMRPPSGPLQPVEERDARLVHAVAELGKQRRQDRERAEHRDRHDEDGRHRERAERRGRR